MVDGSKDFPGADDRLVYIRALDYAEARRLLPPDALADVSDVDALFVVTSAEGQNLAIVEGREAAYATALAHDFRPVSVH
jgi:hypothetical protein